MALARNTVAARNQAVVKAIGGRLQHEREKRMMPRSEVATLSGVHYDTLVKVELGHRGITLDTLAKVATGLGLDISALVQADA